MPALTPASSKGSVAIVPGRARNGDTFFSVLARRSYTIVPGAPARRREADEPLRLVDQYYDQGDPEWSVVEFESDMAPRKWATDVVVVGKAHAPQGAPVQQMMVGIRIGTLTKLLSVTGDRSCHWRKGRPPQVSEPLPFAEMPIRYDRAYGGRDVKSDPALPFFYPRNDMGKGVALKNVKESVQDLPLPNIEDPADLLTPERVVIDDPRRWHEQPLPQGLGWRQRTWYPRSALLGAWPPFLEAGTVTAEERLHLLPPDHVALARQMRLPPYDDVFANGASIGLVLSDVTGSETVGLRGLTADGALDFELPGERPVISIDLGHGEQELSPALHTVCIRPDERQLDLVWRGSVDFGPASRLAGLSRLEAWVA